MGALRLGSLASYLHARGHDVHVLSAREVPRPQTLRQEFPEDRVVRTPWLDVNRLPRLAGRILPRGHARARAPETPAPPVRPATGSAAHGGATHPLRARVGALYTNVVNFPDGVVGWIPYALSAGQRLIKAEPPDLILASGPPFTTLVVGHLLSRRAKVPWVAEFRDRWADDPYEPPPVWRQRLEAFAERRLAASAAALVTVSEPWAQHYQDKYGKRAVTIYNGYDPDAFAVKGVGSPESEALRIVHTGRIYPGRRDPSALFQAVRLLNRVEKVHIVFYGAQKRAIMPLAERHGVADLVEVVDHVPYERSLAAQHEADVLLFMQWNDPREQGNVPGKLFEYLAACRPILGLGLEEGVPASFVRERGAGLFCNDPRRIAEQISAWLEQKRRTGRIAPLPDSVRAGLARDEQFAKLEALFHDLRAA